METHIIPFFKKNKKKVKEITGRDLTRFYQYEKEHGLSGQTIQRHHSNIRQALDYAVDLDIIDHNPAINARLPKRSKYDGARALTSEEGNCLLKIHNVPGMKRLSGLLCCLV